MKLIHGLRAEAGMATYHPDTSEGLTNIRILTKGLRLVTAAYAVVLIVATHVPRLNVSFDIATPVPPDKLLHFAAYGVLGFLVGLIAAEAGLNRRRTFTLALAAIAAFALLDETTQPMFGRSAEPFDWVADVIGAAAGLGLAGGCVAAARVLKRAATAD